MDGSLAGRLASWELSVDGQNGSTPDLTKKLWICDDFMKEIVPFWKGVKEAVLGGPRRESGRTSRRRSGRVS